MEFHVHLDAPAAALGAIQDAVATVDPAALVDFDITGGVLRVAAAVDAPRLAALLQVAGYPVQPGQVVRQPSVCCGDCSG